MAKRLMLVLVVVACSTLISLSYPISPVPLWNLTSESHLVVLADVTEITEAPSPTESEMEDPNTPPDEPFHDAIAHLRVRETWKGEPLASLEVNFPDSLLCPAPPRYVKGKVVLAFLRRNEEVWETTALSYGTIYPRKEDVASFRELVLQAVTLQLAKEVPDNAVIMWHVEASSHAGTRWHGLYFFAPESDELHSYYDQRSKPKKIRLTPAELRQIAEGFVAVPPTDRTLPMALAVLSDFPDPSVSQAAVSAVEALLAEEAPPWWLKASFMQIFRRYGEQDSRNRLQTLGEDFSDLDPIRQALGDDFSEATPDQLRAVWEEARKALGIPKVPPAKILEEEVWGVASNTPS